MSSASAVPDSAALAPSRISSVILLLRLEGFAVAVVTAALYAHTGASWWLFATLWLAPDLSMLGYLVSPCAGARIYNAYHNYLPPALLALAALLLNTHNLLLPVALIWANHIGIDRALGYGLKYGEGFGVTHLGWLGKRNT